MPPPIEQEPAEVLYVRAEVCKLKGVNLLVEAYDDLRCRWPHGGGGPFPYWEEEAYYQSSVPIETDQGVVVPKGSFFSISRLEEGRPYVTVGDEFLKGDFIQFRTLDPRDQDNLLTYGYWHGVSDDKSNKFQRIDNCMEILAVAATGLTL
jgi:hypothetical protein